MNLSKECASVFVLFLYLIIFISLKLFTNQKLEEKLKGGEGERGRERYPALIIAAPNLAVY